MSWAQWQQQAAPGVPTVIPAAAAAAPPLINPAPAVMPPSYSQEQWTQLQQQNWQQWAQWQQQYNQWHQQYGAEYQKSMNALAAQQQAANMPNLAVPPPLPAEAKPPPPSEPPPLLPTPSSLPSSSNSNLFNTRPPNYTTPPPKANWQQNQNPNQKRRFDGGANDFQSNKRYQGRPDGPGVERYDNQGTGRHENQGQGRYDNQGAGRYENQGTGRQENQTTGRHENQGTGRYENQGTGRQENQTTGRHENQGTGRQEGQGRYGNQGPGRFENQGSVRYENQGPGRYDKQGSGRYDNQGSGRYENQGPGRYDNQAPGRYENQGPGRYDNQSRHNSQSRPDNHPRSDHQSRPDNQSRHANQPRPDNKQDRLDHPRLDQNQTKSGDQNRSDKPEDDPAKDNPDELSEAEKKFDKQFAEWEAQFQKWKEQNAEHPDKEQYREYEKKWEKWRAQLLERREQMKKKRLESRKTAGFPSAPAAKPIPSGATTVASVPLVSPVALGTPVAPGPSVTPGDLVTPVAAMAPVNLAAPPAALVPVNPAVPLIAVVPVAPVAVVTPGQTPIPPLPRKVLLPTPSETFSKPPPHMNDEPLQFRGEETDFLKPSVSEGIPGLDLVKDDDLPKKEEDVVLVDEVPKKKGPDFDAISKGINTILGDPKLMNMLSLVSSQQSFKSSDNVVSTISKIRDQNEAENSNLAQDDKSNHSFDYHQRDFINNFDDQTRLSFTQNDQYDGGYKNDKGPTFGKAASGANGRFGNSNEFDDNNMQGPGPESDRFRNRGSGGPFDRFGTENNFGPPNKFGGPNNRDRWQDPNDNFSRNNDRFRPGDRFGGPEEQRFHGIGDRFGGLDEKRFQGGDRFGGSEGQRFQGSSDRFGGPDEKRFHVGPDEKRFQGSAARFGGGEDKVFPGPGDRFQPLDDQFKGLNRFPNRDDRFPGSNNRFHGQNFDEDYQRNQFQDPSDNRPSSNDNFETPEEGLDSKNTTTSNDNNENIPPIEDEIWKPNVVTDYEHKSIKPAEPEVLVEPFRMFDYRHKPLSRIPVPQRPKWLNETVKNIREFEPPVVRSFENLRQRPYPIEQREEWRRDERRRDEWREWDRRERDRELERRERRERDDYSRREKEDYRRDSYELWRDKDDKERRERNVREKDERIEKDEHRREEEKTDRRSDKKETKDAKNNPHKLAPLSSNPQKNSTMIDELLCPPGRYNRPPRIVIILRGPPGSGKTYLAKLIKDKEMENGGSAPRILSLDDYFMVEHEKEITEEGKKVKIKEMIYEYEAEMEESYRNSLVKSFKKTITDGYFSFIIVDNVNDKIKYFGEMWSFAKQNGFQVYVCQLELDVNLCSKRNIHDRSEADIQKCVENWEPTPAHHPVVDASSLIQTESIPEVEMEEVSSPEFMDDDDEDEDDDEGKEDQVRSKWDNFDCSVVNLAKLDGVNKPLRASRTIEEYLQLDSEWTPTKPIRAGQKRVRWADLEEQKQQEKMRAIGFVVGQTDWDRMLDPSKGSSALTQTKYIERAGRF